MKKRFLLPLAGVPAFILGHFLSPGASPAAMSGCNQVCIDEPFPGVCVFTPENYFCHGAQPPWTVCSSEPYTCS